MWRFLEKKFAYFVSGKYHMSRPVAGEGAGGRGGVGGLSPPPPPLPEFLEVKKQCAQKYIIKTN